MSLNDQIRELLLDDPRSLTELSRDSGVSVSMLSRYTRQQRGLSIATLDRIMRTLELTVVPQGTQVMRPRVSER